MRIVKIFLVLLVASTPLIYMSMKAYIQKPSNDSAVSYETLSPAQQNTIKDPTLENLVKTTIENIRDQDFEALAKSVTDQTGLRFSPYTFVNDSTDITLSAEELAQGFTNNHVYNWGFYDGRGNPIELSFKDYYHRFVYDKDYANAKEIFYNPSGTRGNTTNNVLEFYPESFIVEYYIPEVGSTYEGMDWSSLKLVFVMESDIWRLIGIVHDEWTI